MSGFFRAKKTGTYRFFTNSSDKNILEIDGDDIIVNNNINQISYANKSLIAGRYYLFNLYYGNVGSVYPPVAFTSASNSLTVTGQTYGNGNYVASASSTTSSLREARFAFDRTTERWQSTTSRYNGATGSYIGSVSTTTTQGNIVGEWLQLQLPSAIAVNKFTLTSGGSARPKGVKLLGSNTGLNDWVIMFSTVNLDLNDPDGNFGFSETITINLSNSVAYSYYRLVVETSKGEGSSFIIIQELSLIENKFLSCGYTEPNEDGTSGGSTNPDDFIQNATGLTTYYDINPETQPAITSASFPLVIEDNTLQGLFRVSPLALYYNRSDFATTKHEILYIASDDLFNNFNGTFKNYIQLHEKPVANDNERKRFTQFSSDMSFECELNGRIEVRFRRGTVESNAFRYAMLILDVERVPTKQL